VAKNDFGFLMREDRRQKAEGGTRLRTDCSREAPIGIGVESRTLLRS